MFSIVYRAQGKNEQADTLAKRLNLLDEDFYTQRQVRLLPEEYQLLAAISAVQNDDERALNYLESLPNGIFPVWWRFRVLQSPIFIHLQDSPKHILLKDAFEAEMAKQLTVHQKQNL